MRTTLQLDDALFDQAKREATRRGVTLTALVEKGLRLILPELPVSSAGGGTPAGVDLSDNAALLDIMEGPPF
ncbi:MAG: hypothetical protein ABSF98_00695 [Bryobacteraceae bacterium]|jgi:hypothetical protein